MAAPAVAAAITTVPGWGPAALTFLKWAAGVIGAAIVGDALGDAGKEVAGRSGCGKSQKA